MVRLKLLSVFFILVLFLSSCEKEEGIGGTSEIKGKVYAFDYNAELTVLKSEYYAPEEDVYIIYGDDEIYSDDFKTHFDGSYHFQYLREGKYTIFAYSKDLSRTSPSGLITVKVEVEITRKNQTVEVEDIVIIK